MLPPPLCRTYQDLVGYAAEALRTLFPLPEAKHIAKLLIESQQVRSLDILMGALITEGFDRERFQKEVTQVAGWTPVQHILGQVDFYGLQLEVSPDVLIPRPETEELADRIIRTHRHRSGLRVLDVCTGSGCLLLALLANLPGAQGIGLDLSVPALTIATRNAQRSNLHAEWIQSDFLNDPLPAHLPPADLIVSNPPYVTHKEKDQMRPNVLMHEPHLALFVPDTDPLLFYRRLAETAPALLAPGGEIWMEINEQFGPQTVALFGPEAGFREARLLTDLFGKDRFVQAMR